MSRKTQRECSAEDQQGMEVHAHMILYSYLAFDSMKHRKPVQVGQKKVT